MTLNRQGLRRVNSPINSPKRHNTSLRKKALMRKISGEVQFGASSKANLKVVVRVRPQNRHEEESNARCVVDALDDHMLVFDPVEKEEGGFFFKGTRQRCRDLNKRQPLEKKFIFEHVFGEKATNTELYQATAHPLIETLLQGYNCCVFAYGATGAGKTFTMLGRPECPGITSLTLQELYRRLDELKGHKQCEVAVSYLEVYNETVRDLLGTREPLALQETGQQVMVPRLSLHKPSSSKELLQMLAQGNTNRTQHATDANAESSRSHAVFQIFVRQQDLEASSKASVTISKLSMIDLAGSERGAATGYRGARFKEGSSINKSLLALGNCINALADGQRHIPYRDSKLTRLLKDSLGGNCRSVMIAAISPASTSFEDTYNTLRYADRAKTIKTTIRNNVRNIDQHVSNYIKIVQDLKEEVCSLREKMKQYQQKEMEWEEQQKNLVVAPATQLLDSVQMEEEEEEKINAEETEAKRQLQNVSDEQKALHQELLQLEASYRATDLKRHHWITRLARVKVLNFASCKLDKTVNKCERTIHSLDTRLAQLMHCIEMVKTKGAANLLKLQEAINSCGLEPGKPSKSSEGLVEKHQASVILRDSHQLGEHLQTLLVEEFKEQYTSEQLVHLLLSAVRDFYLQFHQKEQCCPEVLGIFQRVVEGLDECRIAWADQQCVAEEQCAQEDLGSQAMVTQLDADHFTCLPSLITAVISPTVMTEPITTFRKSSMMTAVAAPVPLHPYQPGYSRNDAIGTTPLTTSVITTTTTTATQAGLSVHSSIPLECHQPDGTGMEETQTIASTLDYPILSSQGMERLLSSRVCKESSVLPLGTSASGHQQDSQAVKNVKTFVPSLALLNATSDMPSASRFPPPNVATPSNTTVDLPSSHKLFSVHSSSASLPAMVLTTTDVPSALKLSSIVVPTAPVTMSNVNTGVPLVSALLFSTTASSTAAVISHSPRQSSGYSESKVSSAPYNSPRSTYTASSSLVAPVSEIAMAPSTTSLGLPVQRRLFGGEREALDATFSIVRDDKTGSGDSSLISDPLKEVPLVKSPCAVERRIATARSPLVPVHNRANNSYLCIPEKQPPKPQVRGLRGFANKRGRNFTPHKALGTPFTPRKFMVKEASLRSVSTPSLVSQPLSTKKPTTNAMRKLKGLEGTVHHAMTFLKKSNQENVPPQSTRKPLVGTSRPTSPAAHSRSPVPLGKT